MIKRGLKAFKKGWMKFAAVMAVVNTNILMFIIYFIFVPFFSLIRLTDPLRKRWKKDIDSYWSDKEPVDTSLEGMGKLY